MRSENGRNHNVVFKRIHFSLFLTIAGFVAFLVVWCFAVACLTDVNLPRAGCATSIFSRGSNGNIAAVFTLFCSKGTVGRNFCKVEIVDGVFNVFQCGVIRGDCCHNFHAVAIGNTFFTRQLNRLNLNRSVNVDYKGRVTKDSVGFIGGGAIVEDERVFPRLTFGFNKSIRAT